MGFMLIALITQMIVFSAVSESVPELLSDIGYKVGEITDYQLLRSHKQSHLYEIVCPDLDDGRPVKLIQLVGTHYEAGYAFGGLLGPSIVDTYHTFVTAEFPEQWQVLLLQSFLIWQYDSYVSQQIPFEFAEELRGIQQGGAKVHSIDNLGSIFKQSLVISSYPGDFSSDIIYSLLDEFIRDAAHVNNEKILNIIEHHLFESIKLVKQFLQRNQIHCSFFALWGSRTEGGKLITMRNLDWQANTGINQHKLLFVWKITGTIPHVTLGFPVIIGALTGMSKAGITVHEAGLDSLRATELGFQWTLRLRYVMMHAQNLQQAKEIWQSTKNTLGMNHMIASAKDLVSNKPALAMQTMRNYTAWYNDNDIRQRGTKFTDPNTHKQFIAGFAMPEALFRTNHAYDPSINQYRTQLPAEQSSTMQRYFVMKQSILDYEESGTIINDTQAINITAAVAHKGGNDPYKCPSSPDQGTNVISVVFIPGNMDMYAAFEYGFKEAYRTACCGVYMKINMNRWFD